MFLCSSCFTEQLIYRHEFFIFVQVLNRSFVPIILRNNGYFGTYGSLIKGPFYCFICSFVPLNLRNHGYIDTNCFLLSHRLIVPLFLLSKGTMNIWEPNRADFLLFLCSIWFSFIPLFNFWKSPIDRRLTQRIISVSYTHLTLPTIYSV